MLSNLRRPPCQRVSRIAGILALGTLLVPWLIANPVQANRINDNTCRLVDANARPDLLIVREGASVDADAVDILVPSERVTLADNWRSIFGPYGYYWIEITEPASGFIANRPADDDTYSTLRNCPNPTHTPSASDPSRVPYPGQTSYTTTPNNPLYTYCQEVVETGGLTIRSRPSEESERVGGVAEGRNVLVASDTDPVLDATGRYWIAIDQPTPGYISGGYSENFENIEPCRDGFRR